MMTVGCTPGTSAKRIHTATCTSLEESKVGFNIDDEPRRYLAGYVTMMTLTTMIDMPIFGSNVSQEDSNKKLEVEFRTFCLSIRHDGGLAWQPACLDR